MTGKQFVLCAATLALLASLAACEPRRAELRMAAPSSYLDGQITQHIAALLEKDSRFRLEISAEEYSGEKALELLLAGEADIALVSNYLPYREGVATVMPVYASVLHIAYIEDRQWQDGRSLIRDATVLAGPEGSASRLMFEQICKRIGLQEGDWSYVDGEGEIQTSQADLVVLFAPISPERASQLKGYRLFSFGQPADIGAGSLVDAAALLNPPLRPFVIPDSTYGDINSQAVVTVAVDKMLVVRNDLDPSLVYDLINTIRRLRPALSAARPGLFEDVGDSIDVSRSTFVLHQGTQDFLQRAEPTVYERYSGVAEVVVTLMVALVSAGFAGVRILKMRRKNRIDRFYSAAISVRNSISASSTAAERDAAAQKIKELQDTAFGQLVDEKLAADESFRIFITLSNDILADLYTAGR